MIVDIEMTLDADYVCDSYSDVKGAAIDVQNLLEQTYGMTTNLKQTFENIPNSNMNTTINGTSEIITTGYEVTGKSDIKILKTATI